MKRDNPAGLESTGMVASNVDRAGIEHWNNTERNLGIELKAFRPTSGVRGFAKRLWHKKFVDAFAHLEHGSKRLLELGCGGSHFLPYFHLEHGFDVSGIDYSENGCMLARQVCQVNGIPADIVCSDFFAAQNEMSSHFDAVVSFGVVEHFTDTVKTISSFADFLCPGGIIVTVIPNMHGLPGLSQMAFSRAVYDTHEQITPQQLRMASEKAGLQVLSCDYFMFVNFGVINPGIDASLGSRFALHALRALTGMFWLVEILAGPLPANRTTSPYVWCVARAPLLK